VDLSTNIPDIPEMFFYWLRSCLS